LRAGHARESSGGASVRWTSKSAAATPIGSGVVVGSVKLVEPSRINVVVRASFS
jgi:hypothetical protein